MGAAVACGALVLLAMLGATIYVFGNRLESDEPDWESASQQDIEAWAAARKAESLQSQHLMNNYMSSRESAYDEKKIELTKETTDDRSR